jgi:hypothetical protein
MQLELKTGYSSTFILVSNADAQTEGVSCNKVALGTKSPTTAATASPN